jgi:DNA-binding CsgD family transcriptional regulator
MTIELNPNETAVVQDLCAGLIRKQIAHKSGISARTIDWWITSAKKKAGAKTTAQLCAMWVVGRVDRNKNGDLKGLSHSSSRARAFQEPKPSEVNHD